MESRSPAHSTHDISLTPTAMVVMETKHDKCYTVQQKCDCLVLL